MRSFPLFSSVRRLIGFRLLRRRLRVWFEAMGPRFREPQFQLLWLLEQGQRALPPLPFRGLVPPELEPHADACSRQLLISQLVVGAFNRRHLLAYRVGRTKRLILPLPASWLAILRDAGHPVARLPSGLLFALYVLYKYFTGIRHLLRLWQDLKTPAPLPLHTPYGVLMQVAASQLPGPPASQRWDYPSWFARRCSRAHPLREVWVHAPGHSDAAMDETYRLISRRLPLPGPTTPAARRTFLREGITILARGLLALMQGRWWVAQLTVQALDAAFARHTPPDAWAAEYLFNQHQGWVVRPLWSHLAQAHGAQITLLYASVNSLVLMPHTPPAPAYGLGVSTGTWPIYLLQSQDHRRHLLPLLTNAPEVRVDPLVDFQDNDLPVPELPARRIKVAVFDISPFRPSYCATSGFLTHYNTLATGLAFLRDVAALVTPMDGVMVFKRKRRIVDETPYFSTAYRRYVNGLLSQDNVVLADPGINARRVILACDATITFPFSTTGVVARELGKPSIYYDPTGSLASQVSELHGVPVLGSPEALAAWWQEVVIQQKRSEPRPLGVETPHERA